MVVVVSRRKGKAIYVEPFSQPVAENCVVYVSQLAGARDTRRRQSSIDVESK
jgi:hypothetical protein